MKFKQTNQICSPLKLTTQSTLNKAHDIEITKACTVAFMKSRNSLVVWCRVWKKTEVGEYLFFKTLANRFWLTSKYCSRFNKVVHGRPSIKWILWKGKWYVTKSRLYVQFVKKTPLEMAIGPQMKEEGHDQNY